MFFKKHSTLFKEQIKFSKHEEFFIKSHPVLLFEDGRSANLNIFYVLINFLLLLDL